ncbi:MAG: efflux RND transporter periplasmic adaptor subunit [Verrucomicrobia bacterium]|nr:MAG: efflux RND transporter periplasmic adaptor subunit [Verrucomicrobiota bacterium]
MKFRLRWLVLAAVVIGTALFGYFRFTASTQIQNFTAKVERGSIDDVVEATGTINPIVTVLVGSQVSGTIAELRADFNSRVRKGDIVAVIDPALFEGALMEAKSDLANSKANLVAARANLEKLNAALVQTKADYDRAVGLSNGGVLSQQQLDIAKSNFDSANAAVNAAVANITQAEAQVQQKEAGVRVAQTNLDYTIIRSPIDGTVVARNVDLGQTVAASFSAPTIFTIAKDLKTMWVFTKTDESDVGSIPIGKPVKFKVDAFPKETFLGVVKQVRMNPTMVQSVVTYDTIIEFSNPDLKLLPGMTAYVTIPLASVENVLKIPNTALRYKPPYAPDEILAIYKQYGIDGAERAQASSDSLAAATPPQSSSPGVPPAQPTNRPKADTAVVWKRHSDNSMEPVKVSLGITDHAYTQITGVLKGQLNDGDELIIRSTVPKNQTPGTLRR